MTSASRNYGDTEIHTMSNTIQELRSAPTTPRMPVMFVGHGSPLNAITNNPFAAEWLRIGKELPKPRAIVCVSAHWRTAGPKVTAMERPKTIHDFGGFPQQLFEMQYPAVGSPTDAQEIAELTHKLITFDHEWGLDHGTWSVLCRMYPDADIPVVQISLDTKRTPEQHVALARELSELRNRGVLVMGSGNIVHNLSLLGAEGAAYEWATEFDELSADLIQKRDLRSLANYQDLGTGAKLSIPTDEHYLPMLYALALADPKDELTFFNAHVVLGSASMRSFIIG